MSLGNLPEGYISGVNAHGVSVCGFLFLESISVLFILLSI